jgi:hypothetical protein
MKIIRIIYFGYYLFKLDWKVFFNFQTFVYRNYKISFLRQWLSIFHDTVKYNISILEFYQFKFWEKNNIEKLTWAGTGFMYEYQKIMNPSTQRLILDDKREFYKKYNEFFVHQVFSLIELQRDEVKIDQLYKSNKLVFKVSNGKCGTSVRIILNSEVRKQDVISYMLENGFDMVESFLEQHSELNRLSPSGVNTVRIFTQLNAENQVEVLGCRQRISINSNVDNMAAGNIVAYINEETGILEGPGYYSDITKLPISQHPITKTQIIGFQIPYWPECIDLVKKAALKHKQNRSIGWDIVITKSGPGLIEGNHDWCKLVWQLPVNKGLKHLLST